MPLVIYQILFDNIDDNTNPTPGPFWYRGREYVYDLVNEMIREEDSKPEQIDS